VHQGAISSSQTLHLNGRHLLVTFIDGSNDTCPPINTTAGETPGTCTLGTNPSYAVSALSSLDVATTIKFAKAHNVRLVIKDTGHDILGRSTGYGSLEVWVRNLRTGLSFQAKYSSTCKTDPWTGAAITVGGGYTFDDVYKVAKANNVVVVGGGTRLSAP